MDAAGLVLNCDTEKMTARHWGTREIETIQSTAHRRTAGDRRNRSRAQSDVSANVEHLEHLMNHV